MATVEREQEPEQATPTVGMRVIWATRPDLTAIISHVQPLRGGSFLVGLSYSHEDQREHKVRPHYDVYWSECRAVQP